jgi:hypothetical protein
MDSNPSADLQVQLYLAAKTHEAVFAWDHCDHVSNSNTLAVIRKDITFTENV